MGATRYSCPIRLVPTYILPAKEIRLLGKFQPVSFKTERQVCVETDGQTDMARLTRLVMLIKNIYTLWGRKRLLHCVANFWLKSIYFLQGYNKCTTSKLNVTLTWLYYFAAHNSSGLLSALITQTECTKSSSQPYLLDFFCFLFAVGACHSTYTLSRLG